MATRIGLVRLMRRYDEAMREAMTQSLIDIGTLAQQQFNQVVADWRTQVQFNVEIVETQDTIELFVRARGEGKDIWYWVDMGTGIHGERGQPYVIRPLRAPALAFRTGYNPKTAPVAKYNQGDGSASGDYVVARSVLHPGIAGRYFADSFFKEDTDVPAVINDTIRDAVRRVR